MKIQDPLFLLTEQAGMSLSELSGEAAAGVVEVNKLQEAIKTGEPIPILFARYRNENGGVMVQPKMSEGYFSNDIEEREISTDGSTNQDDIVEVVQVKYLLVVSQGDMPAFQERDLFHGNCRRGTYHQAYSARAGTWDPGNEIGAFITNTVEADANGVYSFDLSTLAAGESARLGDTIYYAYTPVGGGSMQYAEFEYRDYGLPVFCGTSGSYDGITTLSFEYEYTDPADEDVSKCVSLFIRNGITVTRLLDGVTSESDNFADLAKYLLQANNRLADDLIDDTLLTIAANFTDVNGFLFNGEIKDSIGLLDYLQATAPNFLLRVTNSGGKFGLIPRLPYNTDYTIKTTAITPEFTFTEEHVVPDGFEFEYISLQDREPVCYVVEWRQQPEADFGLVRTVELRNTGEAADGPFVDIDMSGYCTSENHAVKVGTYYLATRKYVTHHLRLTVRERNYNVSLVVGDIVRVRLRRETSEGDAEYHDKLYEINRIEKTFESVIVYDLTHFPVDDQGRSIVARMVNDAVGAGNDIDLGRATFDCDENSSTSTTAVGTDSGGGGTNAPATGDTTVTVSPPVTTDSPPPPLTDNPTDPLDEDLAEGVTGYTGNPEDGDTLSYDPGCTGAFVEWFSVNKNTGERTSLGSGVGATLTVTTAMLDQNAEVVGVGRCPDSSSPDGYGPANESDAVSWLPDGLDGVDGCQQVDGSGVMQVYYNNQWIDAFPPGNAYYNEGQTTVKITNVSVQGPLSDGKWSSTITWDSTSGSHDNNQYRFATEEAAQAFQWRINPTNGTCLNNQHECNSRVVGCQEMEPGGYGQAQFNAGSSWQNLSGVPAELSVLQNAVRIVPLDPYQQASDLRWVASVEVYSASAGTTTSGGTFDTEAEARAVTFRINPTSGDCLYGCPI
jgi:hypothetical protein